MKKKMKKNDIELTGNRITSSNESISCLIEYILPPESIIFSLKNKEVMKITEEGFFWKGILIENDKEIYHQVKNFFTGNINNIEENKNVETINNIEENKNIIELLKHALQFYANKKNYEKTNYFESKGNVSFVDLDEYGSQARFALDKIEVFDKMNNEMREDFTKTMMNFVESDESQENMLKIIEEFKKLGNADNNIQ